MPTALKTSATWNHNRAYFNHILKTPTELSNDIAFEPLLSLADHAYTLKTGKTFTYHPTFNYETYSNKKGWQ